MLCSSPMPFFLHSLDYANLVWCCFLVGLCHHQVLLVALHFLAATVLLRNWHDMKGASFSIDDGKQTNMRLEKGVAPLLTLFEWGYLAGLPVVEIYCVVIHSLVFGPQSMRFVPLMMTSVYCALPIQMELESRGSLGKRLIAYPFRKHHVDIDNMPTIIEATMS